MPRFKFLLEKESYCAAVFILAHIWVQGSKPYIILLFLYLIALFIVSRDPVKTVWIAFLSALPFQEGKYFITSFISPTYLYARPVPVSFFILFSDILLLILLYLMKRQRVATAPLVSSGIPERLFIPIFVIGCISSWFARIPDIAFFGLFQLVKYFVMFLVARTLLVQRGLMKISLEVVFLFGLFNSLLIISQKFIGGPIGIAAERIQPNFLYGKVADELSGVYRPGGIFDDPNVLASLLGILFPILFILAVTKNAFHKGFIQTTLIISLIGIVFTASRVVIIATTICFSVLLLSQRKFRDTHHKPLMTKRFTLALICILFVFAPFIFLRLQSLESTLAPLGSGTFRIRHLEIAGNFLQSHPFGVGFNMMQHEMVIRFPPIYYIYQPDEMHNLAAQIGASLGIFGLTLFVIFFLSLFREKINQAKISRNRILSYGILAATVQYVMIASFFPWLLHTTVSGFFWIFAAFDGSHDE